MANIKQGKNQSYDAHVPAGATALDVELDWGNTKSKLSITPCDPDGTKLGPYYDDDDSDGTNGKISLKISSPSGLKSGVWKFKVKGVSVVGSEDYTFKTYAHK
jgi:hypothetical protein